MKFPNSLAARHLITFTFCIAVTLTGCGKPQIVGPEKSIVKGTVMLDGTPLPDGQIVFVDATGEPPRMYGAPIKDGAYEVSVTPGAKRVEITAMTTLGVPSPGDPGASMKQLVPARYNEQSTLTAEIPAEGKEGMDFALTSSESAESK